MNHFLDEDNDEESTDDNEYSFSKRQGGHSVVSPALDCQIKCVGKERNPATGKGKSVKEATAICAKKCPVQSKKPAAKKSMKKKGTKMNKKITLRQMDDDDDDSSNSSEEEQNQ